MPVIRRKSSKPYRWDISSVAIEAVANREKMVPREFITADGFGITAAARRYLEPLIGGEAWPPYENGIPRYATLRGARVRRRLSTVFTV
jgi:6-phosphofructokinase 1